MNERKEGIFNRLLELCEHKNLSVNALAGISSVSPSNVKNIINCGSQNTGVVTTKKLYDGFRCFTF